MLNLYTFWRNTVKNFSVTGAIAPSSHSLAEHITAMLALKKKPARVLEVGAGTGVVTEEILTILGPGDHLDICEINPHFINFLRKRFQEEDAFKNASCHVDLFPCDVQKIPVDKPYDYIVSSLPFNAFEPNTVQKILDYYLQILKPSGWISYFEYIGIRPVKAFFSRSQEKERIQGVEKVVKQFINQNEIFHDHVWLNLPPAYVRHCQKKD
ncbi:MAG: methyltransferase domain-containing protein [Candidatus Brocadiae bacterium]|nr:methyltransferase domain-containing protein [Candidatus Brocadiia bacterium]